ncbi:endospore germination permease [Paenibacillus filicis]|uniref:Endospore germination permease n=1 Tax=Paenibacillus filicis TaxID=669464 RepID=A0ABU9DRG5_9BACL
MKITNPQLFWMMLMLEIGTNLLVSITAAFQYGQQDVWICYLIAGLVSFLITYVAVKVSLRYPDKTLMEYAVAILGKWAGKLIVLPFFVQWIWAISLIFRDQYIFIRLNVLPRTPVWLILGTMLIVIVYTVYVGGIEAIGRCSELWGPLLLVALLIVFILTANNLQWKMLLPVYADTGGMAILGGALAPTSLLGESVLLMMLLPFINNPGKETQRAALWGVMVSSVILLIGAVWVLFTFGPAIAAKLRFPFFEMVKLVYLMEFIQNMDILVMSIWLVNIFIKISVYLFIASYGMAQWVGKPRSWKYFIVPLAVMCFILSILSIVSHPPSGHLMEQNWIRYVLPVNMVLIPLLLWGVSSLRQGKKRAAQ